MSLFSKKQIGFVLLTIGGLAACTQSPPNQQKAPSAQEDSIKIAGCTPKIEDAMSALAPKMSTDEIASGLLCEAFVSDYDFEDNGVKFTTRSKACTAGYGSDARYNVEMTFLGESLTLKPGESEVFSSEDSCVKARLSLVSDRNPDYADFNIQSAKALKSKKGAEEFYLNDRLGSKKVICTMSNAGQADIKLQKGETLKADLIHQKQTIKTTEKDQYAKVMNATTTIHIWKNGDWLAIYCFSDVNGDSLTDHQLSRMLGIFSVKRAAKEDAKAEAK